MTLVVYHRCGGKSLDYPPNTILTAKWAVGNGAKAIEYDIVLCNDGSEIKIIVIEPKLIKKAGLNIDALDWAEVGKLDAGNEKFGRQSVPTLEEMLAAIPSESIAHQIHIKGNHEDTVNIVVPKLHGGSNHVLTTFDIEVIKRVKAADSNMPVGWIVKPKQEAGGEGTEDLTAKVAAGGLEPYSGAELQDIVAEAKANSVDIVILCGPRVLNKSDIETVRAGGFQVGAWGVGTNLEIARRLLEFGIDRFTLDNPEQL